MNSNELNRTETNQGNALNDEGGLIHREISGVIVEHREIDQTQVTKKNALDKKPGFHFENAVNVEVENERLNTQISEQKIALKNWIMTVTADDVCEFQADLHLVGERIQMVVDAIVNTE